MRACGACMCAVCVCVSGVCSVCAWVCRICRCDPNPDDEQTGNACLSSGNAYFYKPCDDVRDSHADMKHWYSQIMMERFGIGEVIGELAGVTTSKSTTTRERTKSRTGFEKRSSVVPVLVFVCGKNLLGAISV
ncbi:hypothetical protein J6590_052620 [Homalodisca vitripennis]|nr:hypothetical protein J6590_052620 [Homalodisca vitripennis]